MGKYSVIVEPIAQKELLDIYKSGDKTSIKKLTQFFEELRNHPQTGSGHPEPLKHNLAGYWSRRINKKNRLIYKIEDAIVTVIVVSALGHYGDK